MQAFCVPVSFRTATCAPTATKPPVPAKAIDYPDTDAASSRVEAVWAALR